MATYEINTHPRPAQACKAPRRWRRLTRRELVVLCTLALATAGGIVYWAVSRATNVAAALPQLPPVDTTPTDESLVNLVRFVGTEQFATLPVDKQAPYVKAMRDGDHITDFARLFFAKRLTRDDARRAMQNVFVAVGNQQSKEYFALGTQEQRTAYLDKSIDEIQQAQAKMEAAMLLNGAQSLLGGGSSNGGQSGGLGDGASADAQPPRISPASGRQEQWDPVWIKDMIERTPPGERTNMGAYLGSMINRMKDRGMRPR